MVLCSTEQSPRDGTSEYPQQIFRLRNKKFKFDNALLMSPGCATEDRNQLGISIILHECSCIIKQKVEEKG